MCRGMTKITVVVTERDEPKRLWTEVVVGRLRSGRELINDNIDEIILTFIKNNSQPQYYRV